MKVLVVDDDTHCASLYVQMIQQWGFEAEAAGTGRQALEKAYRTRFDLAFLDIFLPDARGYDLIPKLKAFQPHLLIVAMTGFNSRDLEARVRSQNIAYYIIKPFDTRIMEDIVNHISKKISSREQSQGAGAWQD